MTETHKRAEVPARVLKFMQLEGVRSLEGLQHYSRMDIMRYPGLSSGSLRQIEALLAEHGMSLKETEVKQGMTVPVYEPNFKPSDGEEYT